MNKKTLVLVFFFILLAGSGATLFILSRQTDSSVLEQTFTNIGNAHTFFAVIVIALVILHVRGNLKLLKKREKEFEEKLNQL